MIQRIFTLLIAGLPLFYVAGCASTAAVVKTTPEAAKAEPATVEATAKIAVTGTLVDTIAAVVNDDIITLYDINREAQPVIREAEKKSSLDAAELSKIRHTILDRLVEKKLVEQKIKELNIKVSEEEIRQSIEDVKKQNNMTQEALVSALASQGLSFDQYRAQLQEQLEKLKLVSMEVRSKIQVGEGEMHEYYEANRAKYKEDDTYFARHIYFRISDKSPADEVKRTMTTALMVLDEAKSGKDFIQLAKTYSEDPAARKDGGALGPFKKGDMLPELEQAVMAMKPGDISDLVYTSAGFHIIKLEERKSGKLKPFESVKAEIEDLLYRKKSEERFNQWAKELRAQASVEIKDLKGIL